MRVLMTTTPVPAHLARLVPLARALRGAGHQVLVAGQPDVREVAEAAGLELAVVGGRFHPEDHPDLATDPKPLVGHARYLTPRYLETARDWRPDLIVGSRLEYASLVVAGALGVPVAHQRDPDPAADALGDSLRGVAAFFLGGLCRRAGLSALPVPHLLSADEEPGRLVAVLERPASQHTPRRTPA